MDKAVITAPWHPRYVQCPLLTKFLTPGLRGLQLFQRLHVSPLEEQEYSATLL